ncbi:methyltransferase domain-containing protein [Rhodobacterales bacterium HKCCE4037]|nr:methyltransferase domain-containing protein [Rhodobacterales bacterium HKCCE4037]
MTLETDVANHYTTGALTDRVKAAMIAAGIDPEAATAKDLKAGDEFHTGGVAASDHFFGHLDITSEMRVLDAGCGIGGTSRLIADRFGATVTGVDLTPEFVETARDLTEMVGMGDRIGFHVGSVLDMPVGDAEFDLAVMMHVGMNIADKTALMSEVARCLKPGGTFAVFDVMAGPSGAAALYPVPWSTVAETSFLHSPDTYADAAAAAGLTEILREDRTAFARDFFAQVAAKTVEAGGPPPFGIHLMMGETAPEKFGNYVRGLEIGALAPTEMIFRKDAA